MTSVSDALRAQAADAPVEPGAQRVALVAGAAGKVGEAVLARVVSSGAYARVFALTRHPLETTIAKLEPVCLGRNPLPDTETLLDLPRVDDVYCCVTEDRSYYRRDDVYCIVEKRHVLPIARAARAGGAGRLAIVAPMAVLDQMSGAGNRIADARELDIAEAGYETMVIVRPVPRDRENTGNFMQRVSAWVVSTLGDYMIPRRFNRRLAAVVAHAAVEAIESGAPGLRIIPVHELVEPGGGA